MEAPKKEEAPKPKMYRAVDEHGMIYTFLPCPRKAKGTRGHHPMNVYANFRSTIREARKQIGPISGRQWVKFRKFGSKAYRAWKAKQLTEGILNE